MAVIFCHLTWFLPLRFCAPAEMMGIQMVMRWHPDARHTGAYVQNIDLNMSWQAGQATVWRKGNFWSEREIMTIMKQQNIDFNT